MKLYMNSFVFEILVKRSLFSSLDSYRSISQSGIIKKCHSTLICWSQLHVPR